jgi:hypothetical protein
LLRLQQASAGQPNQPDQHRLPEEGLPFLTAPHRGYWGLGTSGGGRGGAVNGLQVIGDLGGLCGHGHCNHCKARSICDLWSKTQEKLAQFRGQILIMRPLGKRQAPAPLPPPATTPAAQAKPKPAVQCQCAVAGGLGLGA